ncbi:hypothetical protein NC652_025842 [Populus alba x Populus x berolinensis]|nr:hypothetical protein NC652_025842 [Populus alba x Populus x berolinensis]
MIDGNLSMGLEKLRNPQLATYVNYFSYRSPITKVPFNKLISYATLIPSNYKEATLYFTFSFEVSINSHSFCTLPPTIKSFEELHTPIEEHNTTPISRPEVVHVMRKYAILDREWRIKYKR